MKNTQYLQFALVLSLFSVGSSSIKCKGTGKNLLYLSGDALVDSLDCTGPDGSNYPKMNIDNLVRRMSPREGRSGKSLFSNSEERKSTVDPAQTRSALLWAHEQSKLGLVRPGGEPLHGRYKREQNNSQCVVGGSPPRLCKSTYNTTAPMYGVSLTSGQPVTIVQKFPDLLQQVIYETCDSTECDVLHGECIQTYVPYLFLVIPLGPVTLTGQDYVLVESGCTCRPKYATPGSDPDPSGVIPNFS